MLILPVKLTIPLNVILGMRMLGNFFSKLNFVMLPNMFTFGMKIYRKITFNPSDKTHHMVVYIRQTIYWAL